MEEDTSFAAQLRHKRHFHGPRHLACRRLPESAWHKPGPRRRQKAVCLAILELPPRPIPRPTRETRQSFRRCGPIVHFGQSRHTAQIPSEYQSRQLPPPSLAPHVPPAPDCASLPSRCYGEKSPRHPHCCGREPRQCRKSEVSSIASSAPTTELLCTI